MGNCVIAKPSELTPRTATVLAHVLHRAGFPDGVFNVVHGLGPDAGAPLVEHPGVQAVSFTGGTVTGRRVAATAAPMFKKLSLELGGKNPTIVLDEVDMEKAVAGAVRSAFTNNGQVCLAGSRILVQKGVAKEFTDRLVERVRGLRVGDPLDPATNVGPVSSKVHYDKVRLV